MRNRTVIKRESKSYLHLYGNKWLDLEPEQLYDWDIDKNGNCVLMPYKLRTIDDPLVDGFYNIVFMNKTGQLNKLEYPLK